MSTGFYIKQLLVPIREHWNNNVELEALAKNAYPVTENKGNHKIIELTHGVSQA